MAHICARDADFWEFLSVAQEQGHLVLVRADQDRELAGAGGRLRQTVESAEPWVQLAIRIPRGDEAPERSGQFVLRAMPVRIPAPAYRRAQHLPPADVVAILAQEIDAPAGAEPVCRMRFTAPAVSTSTPAARCLRWYDRRWRSERLRHTLRSGCRIRKRQLETACRLRTAWALVAHRERQTHPASET